MTDCILAIEKMNLHLKMKDVEDFFSNGFEGEKVIITHTDFVFCVLARSLNDWLIEADLI